MKSITILNSETISSFQIVTLTDLRCKRDSSIVRDKENDTYIWMFKVYNIYFKAIVLPFESIFGFSQHFQNFFPSLQISKCFQLQISGAYSANMKEVSHWYLWFHHIPSLFDNLLQIISDRWKRDTLAKLFLRKRGSVIWMRDWNELKNSWYLDVSCSFSALQPLQPSSLEDAK